MKDHVHMCLSVPPKYAVSNVVGYIKGKSSIAIARRFKPEVAKIQWRAFWARGYYVSTVGLDEEIVREYIRHQEINDEKRDQVSLGV